MQDDGKEHFYLNLSSDTAGQRAFLTDSKQPEVLAVSLKDGSVIEKIAAPESPPFCLIRLAMKPT